MEGHPLRDIAQRCAKISTSEDDGHIYVALLKVDGQWKHYVGQTEARKDRWQTHERSIRYAMIQLLGGQSKALKLSSQSTNIQRFHIEMATAILEFILNGQSSPAIVVYKIQCGLVNTFGSKHMTSFEQHFMNAFRDIKGTEKLNDEEADGNHPHDKHCPFSGGTKACNPFLMDVLNLIEKDWQQNLTGSPQTVHPLMDIVQWVAKASESDSKSTGHRVHIALISTSKSGVIEFKHYIRVTKCNGKTIESDEMKCLLLQGDTRCKIFNYMCTDKRSAIQELTAIIKAPTARSENPQVCLYTIAAKKVTPVAREMKSVQQHFINALEGWMGDSTSTLVNPPQGGDFIHRRDVCSFSSNVKLKCLRHLCVTMFQLQKNPICSLRFNKETGTYECAYEVLTHQSPNHIVWLKYSRKNGFTTTYI